METKEKIIKGIAHFRKDNSKNWNLNLGYVPENGEPCFETDTYKLKVGDGVTTYGELPYINGNPSTDDKSIIFSDEALKLIGFDAAEIGAQPFKNKNGVLEWIVPSTEEMDNIKTDIKSIKELVGDQAVSQQITNAINEINIDEISKINSISMGDTLLNIIDKNINIPIATKDSLGVVSGSDEILINNVGSMNINKINIDKIVQDKNQIIILDNGDSSDYWKE